MTVYNRNLVMGIDPSINSIGISINRNEGESVHFHIITPTNKMTKKMKEYKSNILSYYPYEKTEIKEADSYHEREMIKMKNFMKIAFIIEKLIGIYKPTLIQMEGISYGSNNTVSVIDLAGLNYIIRMVCECKKIPLYIVSPSELKKYATGSGNAKKELMISGFLMLYPELNEIKKIDDIADAYYLSCYKNEKHKYVSNVKEYIQFMKKDA